MYTRINKKIGYTNKKYREKYNDGSIFEIDDKTGKTQSVKRVCI